LLEPPPYSDGAPPAYKPITRSVQIKKGKTMGLEEVFARQQS
jgi:hypothetical protein